MIAVTIGVGKYSKMAQYAAQELARHTGLRTLILRDEHVARLGLSKPHHLKFHVFDFADEDDVLYFDADLVCLRPWEPGELRDEHALVCVRERMIQVIRDDAFQFNIPAAEYFNSGLLFLNRHRHVAWLRAAEKMAAVRRLRFVDQTALNVTRCRMEIPIKLISRLYNWVGFGEGSLCHRMPVIMAHCIKPDKTANMDFYEGRYRLPGVPKLLLDEDEMGRLSGRSFIYMVQGELVDTISLRDDGTLLPAADARAEGYWLVESLNNRPALTLASETDILHRFVRDDAGCWNSLEPLDDTQLIPMESRPRHLVIDQQDAQRQAAEFVSRVPAYPQGSYSGRGIVICGGGVKYFPSAWVCIRMLRDLGCRLPIELWHLDRYEMDQAMCELVGPFDVRCVDASAVRRQHPVRILRGWELKPYAILHSALQEVLLLDADNVPVADPEFLFESEPYRQTGAVFWPDLRSLGPDRAIWRICGVAYRDEPEFETGQIVADKARCWRAMQLTMHINEHSDFYFRHMHGDKETFHMAWRKLGLPYAMVPTPIHRLDGTMCQHDFQGQRIFQHRNIHKWSLQGRSVRVRGFQREEQCLSFLKELRGRWDGVVHIAATSSDAEHAVAQRLIQQRWFQYIRVGHDSRRLELLADGKVGLGRAAREEQWLVQQHESGRMLLTIVGQAKETCRLIEQDNADGRTRYWSGRWLVCERMPVELRPV